jgi:hypothetical protein
VPVEAAEAAPGVVAAGLRATFMGFLTSKSAPRSSKYPFDFSGLPYQVFIVDHLSLGITGFL